MGCIGGWGCGAINALDLLAMRWCGFCCLFYFHFPGYAYLLSFGGFVLHLISPIFVFLLSFRISFATLYPFHSSHLLYLDFFSSFFFVSTVR